MIYIIALLTLVFTFLGGLFALRFKDKLHLILGFSAGALLGVAFFDLLPESLELAMNEYSVSFITSIIAVAFVVYMVVDRCFSLHTHDDDEHGHEIKRGSFAAGTLAVHSFIDGVAIGLAFKVSPTIGIVVAVAVLVHDFSDGINTVNMILRVKGSTKKALSWLAIDAIAPVIGILVTTPFVLPASTLSIILACFCGFFFYIGAADLLPESHHSHPTVWTTVATVIGVGVLYLAVTLAAI